MIARIAAEVVACPPGPVCLIGSSLGGFTALHFLDRRRNAEAARSRLILLAPALDFGTRYLEHAPPEALAAWEAGGRSRSCTTARDGSCPSART